MDSSEHSAPPRPTPEVGHRVEELLREQLEERGVNPRALLPEEISRQAWNAALRRTTA